MSISKSNTQALYQFVMMNQDYITKRLLKPLKEKREELLKEESGLFSSEIERQFQDRVKWVLISDICSRTNIPVDEVAAFVENINMEELLK